MFSSISLGLSQITANVVVFFCIFTITAQAGNDQTICDHVPKRLIPTVPLFPDESVREQHKQVEDLISLRDFLALSEINREQLIYLDETYGGNGGGPMTCFTPGYPEKAIAAFEKAIWGDTSNKFRIGGRWTNTATNGPVVQGDPLTITYSFVADGTPISGFNGEPTAPSDLDAFMTGIYGSTAAWQNEISMAIEQWEAFSGIDFVLEPNDDGTSLGIFSGVLGVRGDIRIGGHFIDGESGSNTLAYNFFPNNGDMVIDTANPVFYGNTTLSSLNLRNVITHENGHGIGFSHVCPIDQTKLMEPFISRNFDGPQLDDIQAAQRNYGDAYENNDTSGSAHPLGALGIPTTTLDNASTDDNSDIDFYSFTVSGSGTIDATLTPTGNPYLEGPQNANGSCTAGTNFDPGAVSDLTLEILSTDGVSPLATANNTGAGSAETLNSVILPAAGTYFVRVTPDATDSVQLYGFTLDFTPGSGFPETDLSIAKTDGVLNANPGDTIVYTITAINNGPDAADGAVITDTLPANLQGATWVASYSGGAVGPASGSGNLNETITTFPNGGTATFSVTATVAPNAGNGYLDNTASIAIPASVIELTPANNTSSDSNTFITGTNAPTDVEEFNSYSSLIAGGQSSPSDTGNGLQVFGTVTDGGFLLDTTLSQNGRGLTFGGSEGALLGNQLDFGYAQNTHMLAFCFRFASDGGVAANAQTEMIAPRSAGAGQLSYLFRVGRDFQGTEGVSLTIPTDPPNSTTSFTAFPLTPDTWHTAVIQYTSASNTTDKDAGITIWFNPTSGGDAPNYVNIPTNADFMSSVFGNGPFGVYLFGSSVFGSSNGPTVFLDSIATWDGFGVAGVSDLQAALDHLNSKVPPTISDADGVSDAIENGAPNSGDGNNDSTPDRDQSNVVSFPGQDADYVTVVGPVGSTITRANHIDKNFPPAPLPTGLTLDEGLVNFTLTGIANGATVDIDIIHHNGGPFIEYYKFIGGNYIGVPQARSTFFPSVPTNTVRLSLTDGGPFDADGTANGVIVDPGAPGSGGVLLVKLTDFSATVSNTGEVEVSWTTSGEFGTVGFRLFEAVEGDFGWETGREVTTTLILAQGNEISDATYSVTDQIIMSNGETRHYILEEIEFDGDLINYGPTSITFEDKSTRVDDWILMD